MPGDDDKQTGTDFKTVKQQTQRDEEAPKRLDEQDERISRIERNLGLKE